MAHGATETVTLPCTRAVGSRAEASDEPRRLSWAYAQQA